MSAVAVLAVGGLVLAVAMVKPTTVPAGQEARADEVRLADVESIPAVVEEPRPEDPPAPVVPRAPIPDSVGPETAAESPGPLADPAPLTCPAGRGVCAADRHYGTALDFVDDPTEAAKQALREKKLLFVLHVAGNFEDAKFT